MLGVGVRAFRPAVGAGVSMAENTPVTLWGTKRCLGVDEMGVEEGAAAAVVVVDGTVAVAVALAVEEEEEEEEEGGATG